jgi:hypothetical protein
VIAGDGRLYWLGDHQLAYRQSGPRDARERKALELMAVLSVIQLVTWL